MTFTVALIGRPNVGKSTLFNRLVGKKLAIVDDTPGVTRDRREAMAKLADLSFKLIDTAGLEEAFDGSLEARMREQTEEAIKQADLALMMIDGREGVVPMDEHFANFLRKQKTPIVLVANKCEKQTALAGIGEAYGLGLGDVIAISAEHGEGLGDLYDALEQYKFEMDGEEEFIDHGEEDDDEIVKSRPLQLAIVGRPNAGKSTLINTYLGEDRMLTGAEAGITRDSIASDFEYDGKKVKLVDTAGLRKQGKINEKLEKLAAADSLRAIKFAQIVILMVDMEKGLEKQDLLIASNVINEGRALVIGANKWDSVKDKEKTLQELRDRVKISLPQVRGVPIITLSALNGKNINVLMDTAFYLFDIWNTRIPTAKLNNWLKYKTEQHPPPLASGRRLKIKYISQIKTRPPTFYLNVSIPEDMPESYIRYLAQGMREDFDLKGIPIRILMRKSTNPYEHLRNKKAISKRD
ncbi:MAG: ribosome biogenesis GTPase Der [Alphaproteobacteria bacterium]